MTDCDRLIAEFSLAMNFSLVYRKFTINLSQSVTRHEVLSVVVLQVMIMT